MAKIYLSCHDRDEANRVDVLLAEAGHLVVSTWHTSKLPRPLEGDGTGWSIRASRNRGQILTADALVLIAGPDRYPGGKFCEFIWAACHDKPVFVFGREENGMLHLVPFERAGTIEELIALLESVKS